MSYTPISWTPFSLYDDPVDNPLEEVHPEFSSHKIELESSGYSRYKAYEVLIICGAWKVLNKSLYDLHSRVLLRLTKVRIYKIITQIKELVQI